MAKRKIELFIEITNQNEFENILETYADSLICAEIYSSYFGSCTALDRLFTTIKLDWSNGNMILLKVPCDEIQQLARFRNNSEPVYMFIVDKKVTRVFRGVDNIRFGEVAKRELHYFKVEQGGEITERTLYELDETTPDELEWFHTRTMEQKQELEALTARRIARQAARKYHRAELMTPHLEHLNFVLYWPHAKYAHPELYEKWDDNNIIMVGREEIELTKEVAEDVLYAGDAPINEASMNSLLSGPSLAICFRLLDSDKHFVSLVRWILYEDKSISKEKDGFPTETAFEHYKTYSLTKEEIWKLRREERHRLKEEKKENRARRLSEMRRLALQAKQDAIEAKRAAKEQLKLDLLKAGNLAALDELKQKENDEEDESLIVEEIIEEAEEEEISEEEDENEYFPPAGLVIPGFYSPPNDIAKVNGLAILFPRLVLEHVTPQSEFLPPHVLVMLDISKRYTAIDAIKKHKSLIIHMGIFRASNPYNAIHVAYSVKQFDSHDASDKIDKNDLKIAFMLSSEVDFALLELMDLNPIHVSRDSTHGEDECAAMFPVDYADDYPEFEDFGVLKSSAQK